LIERGDVDWFHEVLAEAAFTVTLDIALHAKAAQRYAFDIVALLEDAHQVEACLAGESEAAGLDSIEHRDPSTIGMDTLIRSKGKIPEEEELHRIGASEKAINSF
jgi:hypothetical protein